jgi:galactose mutarotase-like enzyme
MKTMIHLANNILSIKINPKGAELQSVYHLQNQIEYLWQGNPEYWGKHAPVLFPIVGQLKDNTYSYYENNYSLPRHGFARDMYFELLKQEETSAAFILKSNEETLSVFPFPFSFQIKYSIHDNVITNEYCLQNLGDKTMFFSVGGHPAFNVPLVPNSFFNDYYLELEQFETIDRWPLQDGLLKTHSEPFLHNQKIIPLSYDLFSRDAVVLKNLQSKTICLKSNKTRHGLTMNFNSFPYFGIWTAKEAPFVCLEPWHGIADSLYHNKQLTDKEGIIQLEAASTWKKAWCIDLF